MGKKLTSRAIRKELKKALENQKKTFSYQLWFAVENENEIVHKVFKKNDKVGDN